MSRPLKNERGAQKKSRFNHKRMWADERRLNYGKIFRQILDPYLEVKATSASASIELLYIRCKDGMDGVQTGGTQRVGRVVITASDFVADVELAAKKALSTKDYMAFLSSEILTEDSEVNVGRELVKRRIYPLKGYLRAKDVV